MRRFREHDDRDGRASTTPSASTTTPAPSCRSRRGTTSRGGSTARFLARLVAEHRLDEDEAHELAARPRLRPGQGGLQAVTARALARAAAGAGRAVERPRYDRAALAEGVVHLGLGAFHRAHQAAYLDEIAARGDMRWGVVGVSLRSPAVRDTLAPQDGLYTLVERDAAGERARIMAPLRRVLVAPEAPAAVVAAMAQPSVRIVTLTVTEKGYGLARDRGELDTADPASRPTWRASAAAHRGRLPRRGAQRAARRRAAAVHRDQLRQPARQRRAAARRGAGAGRRARSRPRRVDRDVRRVPVLDGRPHRPGDHRRGDRRRMPPRIGYRDEALGRDRAVQPVGAAGPLRRRAARFRRGRRDARRTTSRRGRRPSCACSTARIRRSPISAASAGSRTSTSSSPSADRRALIERLWDESAATLDPAAGIDLAGYRAALMARFANPGAAPPHASRSPWTARRSCRSGCVAPWRARLERGLASPTIELAVAAWMAWQRGADMQDRRFVVDDPLAETTAMAWAIAPDADAAAARLLALARGVRRPRRALARCRRARRGLAQADPRSAQRRRPAAGALGAEPVP